MELKISQRIEGAICPGCGAIASYPNNMDPKLIFCPRENKFLRLDKEPATRSVVTVADVDDRAGLVVFNVK